MLGFAAGLVCFNATAQTTALQINALQSPSSLSLVQALQQTTDRNRFIVAAQKQKDAAAADVLRANIRPNPILSGATSNTRAGRFQVGELDTIVRIEQTFERGNKRDLRVASARGLEQAAVADVLDVIRQQRAQTALTYFDLAVSQKLLALALENELNFRRLLDGASKRFKAGDIAQADVSRLTVELSRAVNDVRASRNAQTQAQFRLAAQLAEEQSATELQAADSLPLIAETKSIESLLSPNAQISAIDQAIANRADVRAAQARIQAQEKALALAKSLTTRDVTFGAQTERTQAFGGRVFGVSASIPLLFGNDFSGELVRSSVDLAIAQTELERVIAQVRTEITSSLAQLFASKDRLYQLLIVTLPEATKASQAIEYAYTRGAASLTDLFDARRQFNAVQVEATTAQSEFSKSLFLYRAAIESTPP